MNLLLRDGNEERAGSVTLLGFCSTTGRAESGGRAWTFKRLGFLKPVVTVRRAGETTDLLRARVTASGNCELSLDGRQFRWRPTSCLRGEYAWVSGEGAEVIRYRQRMPWRRGAQRIEIVAHELPADTAALLGLLGAFLLMLTVNDAAAITAAIIAASIVS